MTIFYCLVVVLGVNVLVTHGVVTKSLAGVWRVHNQNKSIDIAATVPGSIYSDLMKAGVLEDIYYRFNDVNYRWVANETWTFYTNMSAPSGVLGNAAINLVAEGLDTVAKVELNGKILGKTNNMFRKYHWPIKDNLMDSSNIIRITFESPLKYAARQAHNYPYMVPPTCPPPVEHGDCYRNFIRKEACSFSWDWGPSFPTSGIWKDIYIESYDMAVIKDLIVVPIYDGVNGWRINTTTCFDITEVFVNADLDINMFIPTLHEVSFSARLNYHNTCVNFIFPITEPVKLWWPNGMGKQNLYDLMLTCGTTKSKDNVIKLQRFGFRTVQLIQEPIAESPGLSFYFVINGHPVFMKGSNWIPADSLQERITDDYLSRLLLSAKEANMNMLRVWGGGIYESDKFYELADQYGILIWQDFMFACSLFPTNQEFLQNVQQEVQQQVRRLKSHPSIALWSGNNENEGALSTDWYHIKANYSLYYNDYVKLYINTIRDVVLREDPTRPFVASSPTNGVESESEGWVAKDPYSLHYGDVHYYDYNKDGWDWQNYPVTRFASEYGFQSWCSFETLEKVSTKEDWNLDSQFVDHRQHHADGNTEMMYQISKHLKMPTTKDTVQKFKDFIYLSQINHAMSIKTESEAYRRNQNSVANDVGHTMGALYWQLNDIWQAPTWASIEYGGKWKMLHYYAMNFFNQTILSPYVNGTKILCYYISDPSANFTKTYKMEKSKMLRDTKENNVLKFNQMSSRKYYITINVMSWKSLTPQLSRQVPITLPSEAAGLVYEDDVNGLLKASGCNSWNECFLYFNLGAQSGGPVMPGYWIMPNPDFQSASGLTKADIKVLTVRKLSDNTFDISLQTSTIAPFVWLEATGIKGRFSDNGFMAIAKQFNIIFHAWEYKIDASKLKLSLSITSLMDIYLH